MPNRPTQLANLAPRPIDWSRATFAVLRQLTQDVVNTVTDEQLRSAFEGLSEVDRNILAYSYGLGSQDRCSLSWIACQVGVHKSRVGQLRSHSEIRFRSLILALTSPLIPPSESSKENLARTLCEQLGLPLFIAYALVRRNVTTSDQLCALSVRQLASFRSVGIIRLRQIEAALAERGLALAKDKNDMGGP
jgi:hypothetical protein